MKLTFWGAARQVTGSMFLLELEDGFQMLIDCGMDMENSAESMPLYPGAAFPFDASRVNLVLLTHAHLDHIGKIPNLVREGFEGKIVCTDATHDLAKLLLYDSAALNRKKLNAYHKKRNSIPNYAPDFAIEELYQEKHVEDALTLFTTVAKDQLIKVRNGLSLKMVNAGHLLGACHVYLEVKENGEKKSILFSGDLGRYGYPLLNDPTPPPAADYLVCETTYGQRFHQSTQETEEAIFEAVKAACVDKPGKLILPAFSIGRTQAILFTLNKIFRQGKLPEVPVYADSPLAMRSNAVYERYSHLLNPAAQAFKKHHKSLFDFPNLQYILENRESKLISKQPGRAVYVSSSGMLEGGRIQHHIRNHLQDPDATIMMVGYSAEGTLGHKLMNANGKMEMGNKIVAVLAKVQHTDAFSGHGDHQDLINFVKAQSLITCKKVFLVHGEAKSMDSFKEKVRAEGFQAVFTPQKGEVHEL